MLRLSQTMSHPVFGGTATQQPAEKSREILLRPGVADHAFDLAGGDVEGGTWTHDFPIFPPVAKELGRSVSTDMPNEVLELMKLYPQPVPTQGGGSGVEYLPIPRQKEALNRQARPWSMIGKVCDE